MLKKIFYLYYKWKISKAVKRKSWEDNPKILNFNKGIYSVIDKIDNGIVSNFFFSFAQKEKLLKYCFQKIVYLKSDQEIVKELIINFADNYVEYVISWLKSKVSIFQLPIVREAISGSDNQYILDLVSNNNVDSDSENNFNLTIIGAKNSIPIELVQKMYEIQAKGCPTKK